MCKITIYADNTIRYLKCDKFLSFDSKLKRPLSWNQILKVFTAWKVSKYGGFPGPYFPVFELNTEIYSVNLRIQPEYRKIQGRKSSVFGHFSRSVYPIFFAILLLNLKESTFKTRKNAQRVFSLLKFSSFKIIESSILRRHPEFYKLIYIWWRPLS